jgi:hypothetical protein
VANAKSLSNGGSFPRRFLRLMDGPVGRRQAETCRAGYECLVGWRVLVEDNKLNSRAVDTSGPWCGLGCE